MTAAFVCWLTGNRRKPLSHRSDSMSSMNEVSAHLDPISPCREGDGSAAISVEFLVGNVRL
jgi:hypothetical protein